MPSDTVTKPRNAADSGDAFIIALLEPLATGVPVDTHFNSLMRRARKRAWFEASSIVDLHRAQLDHCRALLQRALPEKYRKEEQWATDHKAQELLTLWRAAVAHNILTPAPDQASVAWKRSVAKDKYLPITREAIDKSIADDEAFLKAHPITSRTRLLKA